MFLSKVVLLKQKNQIQISKDSGLWSVVCGCMCGKSKSSQCAVGQNFAVGGRAQLHEYICTF